MVEKRIFRDQMENVTPVSVQGVETPSGSPDEEKVRNRKRSLAVLILRHLHDEGYAQTYQSLCAESGLSLSQLDVADNIDLNTVVQGYEDFYESKYGRRPKLMRRLSGDFQLPPVIRPTPSSAPGHPGHPAFPPTPNAILAHAPMHMAHGVYVHGPMDTMSARLASTFRAGTSEPVTQEELVNRLSEMANPNPNQHFTFERPKRNTSKKRSTLLNLTELQEDILYALVGCTNVGWSIRSITNGSKDFLSQRCGISKDTLQLFFKNRAQRPKRQRSSRRTPGPPQVQTHLAAVAGAPQFHPGQTPTPQGSPQTAPHQQMQPLNPFQPAQLQLHGLHSLQPSFQPVSQAFAPPVQSMQAIPGMPHMLQPNSQPPMVQLPSQATPAMHPQVQSLVEQQSMLVRTVSSGLDAGVPMPQGHPVPVPHMPLPQPCHIAHGQPSIHDVAQGTVVEAIPIQQGQTLNNGNAGDQTDMSIPGQTCGTPVSLKISNGLAMDHRTVGIPRVDGMHENGIMQEMVPGVGFQNDGSIENGQIGTGSDSISRSMDASQAQVEIAEADIQNEVDLNGHGMDVVGELSGMVGGKGVSSSNEGNGLQTSQMLAPVMVRGLMSEEGSQVGMVDAGKVQMADGSDIENLKVEGAG